MDANDAAIFGQMKIGLDGVCILIPGQLKCGQRIFGRIV
jgi:hypothetical protein